MNEIFDREQEITEITYEKYLGQIISSDRSNAKTFWKEQEEEQACLRKLLRCLILCQEENSIIKLR